ncbi:MAG: phosphoenolpyruvate carboxykinase (GTP) [Patescibacteria group bacterium]
MRSLYMHDSLNTWINEMARLTKPENIVWIDGCQEQLRQLTTQAIAEGEISPLNEEKFPGCLYHRTDPSDVARVEHLTFICTARREDAGPTNNWMAPEDARARLGAIFDGAMRGRTMYVIPYLMGVPGSPFSRVGIELTDSIYVVLNMGIMTRMGGVALRQLGDSPEFVKGLHAKADLDPNRRYICHFPEENEIWSVGSGYGGNVLLGKKCFSLRIASWMARREGWLAEHMLILGVEDPEGNVSYVAGAFPSACGKTNLAMMVPPAPFRDRGYKVWTVGDDIAWMRVGPDGRLWATNPEAGFFGVAPGTSIKTNPNAMATVGRDTIFTNVVLAPDGTVWWEGMGIEPPASGLDWQGRPWTPGGGEKGAHPNSRFTAPARNCPCISPYWEDPQGVPISAILFGGRRARVAPLIYESFSWRHGVYVGASMASETTTANMAAVGVVRRDPMAMLPFCGYNMGDYFAHWLEMGKKIPHPPRIFHVNWFRTDTKGDFVWPGFSENFRAVKWALDRCEGKTGAVESPIGYLPGPEDIDLAGLDLGRDQIDLLLAVDREAWLEDLKNQEEFFAKFDRLPREIREEMEGLRKRLG